MSGPVGNCFSEDDETNVQGPKIHINMDSAGLCLTASAAAVPRNTHPVESETPVPASAGKERNDVSKPMEVSSSTFNEGFDEVEPENAYSAASLVNSLNDNAGNSLYVAQFSCKIYQEFVANLDQITEVSCPLRDLQDKHL